MRKYLMLLLAIGFVGCKSAKPTIAEGIAESDLAANKIIKGHYENTTDFSSVYIKASARYRDEKQSQNVTAEIRIKKDEKILVSVRFLGITMAKALITPTAVKYYEKINQNYFEGDFTTLSKWLGTDLDFDKLQNMLIGRAIDDLKKEKYLASIEGKLYKLENAATQSVHKTYYFEGENFLLKKQEVAQPEKNRQLTVTYPAYSKYADILFPSELSISATEAKNRTNISIDYNNVSFNEEISFPYSVPEGYERIFID